MPVYAMILKKRHVGLELGTENLTGFKNLSGLICHFKLEERKTT